MTLTIGTGPFGNQSAGSFNFDTGVLRAHTLYFEDSPRRVRVVLGGETVADTKRAKLLHETGHLPVYYFPEEDIRMDLLEESDHSTHCPFKGDASYWSVRVGDRVSESAVWSYSEPVDSAPPLAGYLLLKAVPQLSSYEMAEDVVMVVNGGDGDVYLRRPIGLVSAGGSLHQLEPFDKIPPKLVQVVAVRISVELPLEVEHHKRPASEHQPVSPLTPEDVLADLVKLSLRNFSNGREPGRIVHQRAHHERDGLGRASVGDGAQEVGELGIYVLVIDGVAELVEHRVHPVGVRLHVHKNPHVVGVVPPYGEAEAVLVLALSLVEVALCQDVSHLEAQSVVGIAG
jgi:uncharacterized protein (DUF427 family)